MTSPVDRAHAEIHSADRLDWLGSLQPGSPVSIMSVDVKVATELYVGRIESGVFALSDGRMFGMATGIVDRAKTGVSIMVQPTKEDRRDYLARKLRNEINAFPWKALSVEQLDAVIKFAEAKLTHNLMENNGGKKE